MTAALPFAFVPDDVSALGESASAHPSTLDAPMIKSTHRVVIDRERPEDVEVRETLLDRAFGPARFAKTCQRLRAGRLPAHGLSLVARAHGGGRRTDASDKSSAVVGTVRLWHVEAGGVPALMLGPLAVGDAWRRHRIGARLMETAIERARAQGHVAILLVGDAPYYARFGFERRPARDLRMPGPVEDERFLALELVPRALDGARGVVRATGAIDMGPERRGRRGSMRRAA